MEQVEQDFWDRIIRSSETLKHFEPVGLKDMCRYITKFLKDESRYGDHVKQFNKYYKLASQYPNNVEKISNVFAGTFTNSMTYGFVSSSFLEKIMSAVLTKEEKEKSEQILNDLKNSGLSRKEYFQSKTEYNLSKDLFDQLSLIDAYVYYEMRKYEIQLKNEEMNRIIDAIDKRNDRISKDPQLWLKM